MPNHDTPDCQCGCGYPTRINRRTRKPNRFIHGHRARLQQTTPNLTRTLPDGTIAVQLSRGCETVIDAKDYQLIAPYRWYAFSSRANTYAAHKSTGCPTILMHRLIVGATDGEMVDHEDGDTLNNRRANLRPCDNRRNQQNRKLSSDNTSGYKGVSWHIRDKFWRANIRADGRQIFLGSFNTPEEAARAYDAAARTYFGEFARLNFPDEGERAA
jgi:hypothetical protein